MTLNTGEQNRTFLEIFIRGKRSIPAATSHTPIRHHSSPRTLVEQRFAALMSPAVELYCYSEEISHLSQKQSAIAPRTGPTTGVMFL